MQLAASGFSLWFPATIAGDYVTVPVFIADDGCRSSDLCGLGFAVVVTDVVPIFISVWPTVCDLFLMLLDLWFLLSGMSAAGDVSCFYDVGGVCSFTNLG